MPPRPRPEGGQDPSPNFLNEGELPGSAAVAGFKNNLAQNSGKKEDLLIIDSWTGGPTASPATNEDNDKFYLRANSVEEKSSLDGVHPLQAIQMDGVSPLQKLVTGS